MSSKQEDLLQILNANRDLNSFLIRTYETEPDTEWHIFEKSAAIYEKRSECWLFSLDKEGDFTELYKQLVNPLGTFYVNGTEFLEEIRTLIPDAENVPYIQYNIEKGDFVYDNSVLNPDVEVVNIDKSWTDFILSLYKSKEFGYREYIDWCIDNNPGFGALYKGEKAGYVLIHKDGEIGSMVISENARGKSIGRTLMQFITPAYANQASTGCGFVLVDNINSQKMMEKSCFKAVDKIIMWVYH